LTILLGVVAAVCACAVPAEASFPGKNGKIAFKHDLDVYVANPDGSGSANLTADDPAELFFQPAWSADGASIAYMRIVRVGYVGSQVWSMNGDGSGKTQVTQLSDSAFPQFPAWAPDGARLAYSRAGVHVVNRDGSGDRLVAPGWEPSWSPDGTKLAFTQWLPGATQDLWTADADGGHLTRICCDGMYVEAPDWSPDGHSILINVWFPRNVEGFYRVNADGSGLVRLFTRSGAFGRGEAAWSPDGTRIVFVKGDFTTPTYEPYSVFTAKLDGTDEQRVSGPYGPSSSGDAEPSWQPISAPRRDDYKNANKFCKAEQAFWGDQFASRYGGGANAFGKCVSQSH